MATSSSKDANALERSSQLPKKTPDLDDIRKTMTPSRGWHQKHPVHWIGVQLGNEVKPKKETVSRVIHVLPPPYLPCLHGPFAGVEAVEAISLAHAMAICPP